MIDPFEDPSGSDPANWDCCDEHETVFWKGTACEKCIEEDAQQQDAALGMAWWNRLTEAERAEWLRRANTAVPAEAWELFKRQQFQPTGDT